MKKICKNKVAEIAGRVKVVWSSKRRGQMITGAVETLSNCF